MLRSFLACVLLLLLPVVSQAQSASRSSSLKYQWKRVAQNPVIPAATGSLLEGSTGAPDVLLNGDSYYLYFYGQAGENARIGVSSTTRSKFDGVTWGLREGRIVELGPPGSCDETACIDPSAVAANGHVFLYYTGVSSRRERTICLAISDDGIHFKKYEKNPVMIGTTTPEVVYHKNTFYLFFRRQVPDKEGYKIHCATSKDGYHFTDSSLSPVLSAGPSGSWDSFSVETPRIFSEGNLYYMLYAGSDRYKDFAWNAGLATSRDLIHWTKYAGNPIFTRGYPGTFDEGAVSFLSIAKEKGRYYLWYQGLGGGLKRDEPEPRSPKGSRAQVGAATLDASYFYVKPEKKK